MPPAPPRASRRVWPSDFPGIEVSVHAAAEWAENPAALARAKAAVAEADIVVANLLFIEEHLDADPARPDRPPRPRWMPSSASSPTRRSSS